MKYGDDTIANELFKKLNLERFKEIREKLAED